jgi:hypothetical protein
VNGQLSTPHRACSPNRIDEEIDMTNSGLGGHAGKRDEAN